MCFKATCPDMMTFGQGLDRKASKQYNGCNISAVKLHDAF